MVLQLKAGGGQAGPSHSWAASCSVNLKFEETSELEFEEAPFQHLCLSQSMSHSAALSLITIKSKLSRMISQACETTRTTQLSQSLHTGWYTTDKQPMKELVLCSHTWILFLIESLNQNGKSHVWICSRSVTCVIPVKQLH